MQPPVLSNDAWKETTRAPEKEPDRQRAHLALQRSLRDVDCAAGCNQRLARFSKKNQALRCQPDASRATIKQRAAHLLLEIRDLLRDRGLRDVHLPARLGKALSIGYGAEVTQMPQFH